MKYISLLLALALILSLTSLSTAQDDCLDVSVAKTIANNFYAGYSFNQPASQTAQAALLRSLAAALSSTSSPYNPAIGVGYSNNDYYSVQSCATRYFTTPCAYTGGAYFAEIVSQSTYGDYFPRYFSVDSTGNPDLSAPAYNGTTQYLVSERPFFNANGWSNSYQFVNFNALSRSYVIQANNSARIQVDRDPTEPCDSCRSRSPATQLAPFIAASARLGSYENIATTSDVVNAALYLGNQLSTFQIGVTIITVGVGYDNGNVIFVTDCQASSAAPECSSSRYVAEVRNVAVYGNQNLHAFALGTSGALTAARDEGTPFNTTGRPWYLQANGWTDYYTNANAAGTTALSRSFAASFDGGVVTADSNPNQVCPVASSGNNGPSTCPPPPCGGNGGSHPSKGNDGVVVNFYFADMLAGANSS